MDIDEEEEEEEMEVKKKKEKEQRSDIGILESPVKQKFSVLRKSSVLTLLRG